MDTPASKQMQFSMHPMARVLILTFGGVAALQFAHSLLLAGSNQGEGGGYAAWLQDGMLALPAVALAVALGVRRSRRAGEGAGNMLVALLFAGIMAAGSAIRHIVPVDAHADHEGAAFSTTDTLKHMAIIAGLAWLYAFAVDAILAALVNAADAPLDRLPRVRGLQRIAVPAAVVIALVPALVFTGNGRAEAQTSFPDQVIHPKGNLVLLAQPLADGSYAYVAPDYGANGVRPTIEMTEGETLNITVKNQLPSDMSLHVHGVHYNQDSDGTRHSGSFVSPGQTKVYQWRAAVGTAGYWHYHDHVMGDDEGSGGIAAGLYGGLIVRRPGDPRPAHTFVIVGQDKTLNGRVYPDTPTPTAKQGELVEWLVISHGNRVHTFHLHAHRWLNPNRQSDPSPSAPANVGSGWEDNHIIGPGQSFGFLAIAGEDVGPGMWMYHCHFQDHASAMKGFFKVLPSGQGAVVETSHFFPETGKTVAGRFLDYWKSNGGLAQQGFPISDPFMEKSDLDGKTYQVQYFERAVFESHPELKAPYDVLLSQLGTFQYKAKYPNGGK